MADLTFTVTRNGVTYQAAVVRCNTIDMEGLTMECVARYPCPNLEDPESTREIVLTMDRDAAIAAGMTATTINALISVIKQGFINRYGD